MRIQVAELELAEKEAQLHAIQNRINPHFLYNSLDVVNWMVIRRLGPSNEVSHAIKTMADSFRTIFHDNRLLVSLEEEVTLLKRYVDFLNVIDYRDLKYICQIENEIKMKSVPRLLLQPLIENCYMHSLDPLSIVG